MTTIHDAYKAYELADAAWMMALREAFPGLRHYGDLRYSPKAHGVPGSALAAAHDARMKANLVWLELIDESRKDSVSA